MSPELADPRTRRDLLLLSGFVGYLAFHVLAFVWGRGHFTWVNMAELLLCVVLLLVVQAVIGLFHWSVVVAIAISAVAIGWVSQM